jgi:secreted Zn-dependent insulinase-like peptidase
LDFKRFKLKNNLDILLISNKNFNKSLCALDFNTGSINDSIDGMSHLLEHLIFKDKKLFDIVFSNQGALNASVGLEHSNFRFKVDHLNYKKALNIFSNCFLNPKINLKNIKKEINIIDSELDKNLFDKSFLAKRLHFMNVKKGHLINKFHHGSKKTLQNISKQDLECFYEKFYSVNNAKLVLASNKNISELYDLACINFLSFENKKLKYSKVDPNVQDKNKVIYFNSNSEPFLKMIFNVRSLYPYYESKPQWFITYLINSLKKGSLKSKLINENYIKDMWASFDNYSFSSFLNLDFKLTAKGIKNINYIYNMFISYIRWLISRKSIPKYLFDEQKNLSKIYFKHKELSEDLDALNGLSKNMRYYSGNKVFEKNDVIFKYSTKDIKDICSDILKSKYQFISNLSDRSLNKKDIYTGIKYHSYISRFKDKNLKESFSFPLKNKFIANSYKLIKDDNKTYPFKVIDNKRGEVWFVQDKKLKTPTAYVNFIIKTKKVNDTPFSKLLSIIYTRMVERNLFEIADEAGDAGLSFGIERDDRGISIFIIGFSEKIFLLYKEIINKLKTKFKSFKLLEEIKENLLHDYEELENSSSYNIAQYEKYNLMHESNIHKDFYFKFLKNVKILDINNFLKKLYKNIFLKAYVYGNLPKSFNQDILDYSFKALKSKTLKEIPKDKVIYLNTPFNFYYLTRSKSPDHAMSNYFIFGKRSTHLSALIQIIYSFLKPMFLDYLRNKKNLAYVLDCRLDFFENVLGISFSVLSKNYNAYKLLETFEDFLIYFMKKINKVSTKQLIENKKSLINSVNKNNISVQDWMSDIILTSILKGNVNYVKELSCEIQKASLKDIVNLCEKSFNIKTRRAVTVFASRKSFKLEKINEIKNVSKFKKRFNFE